MSDEKFPVKLTHPKTGGTTHAATRSSLRVLEARGWRRVTETSPSTTVKVTKPE